MGIDDTSKSILNRDAMQMFLLESDIRGSSAPVIEEMEAAGQAQLGASDRLPVKIRSAGGRAAFEALGFTFGEADPKDPLFMPATLPAGWKRKKTDHAMGSVIVDGLGRERVSIFYKAAFYDRDASMSLQSVSRYVARHVEHGEPLVTSDEWATGETVMAAMREHRDTAAARAAEFRGYAEDTAGRDTANRASCAEQAEQQEVVAVKYEAAMRALVAEQGKDSGTAPPPQEAAAPARPSSLRQDGGRPRRAVARQAGEDGPGPF